MQNKPKCPRSQRGETLVETLVAILIVALVSAALASMISTASHLNKTAMDKDKELFEAISGLSKTEGGNHKVTITVKGKCETTKHLDITLYQDQSKKLAAYQLK